jgi:hypothetical protein
MASYAKSYAAKPPRLALVALMPLLLPVLISASQQAEVKPAPSRDKRPVTVADTIEMARIAGDGHYSQQRLPMAYFSPDGHHFVVILRKGNLRAGTNDYSMLLFRTADAFHSPRPTLLVRMSSSSDREAIRDMQWLSDGHTVAFIGETPNSVPQVYTIDSRTRHLEQRTTHATAVLEYRMSPDGRELTFAAEGAERQPSAETRQKEPVVVTTQHIAEIIAGNLTTESARREILLQRGRSSEKKLAAGACVIDVDGTTATSYTPAAGVLQVGERYYWQVQAFDDTVTPIHQGAFSSQFNFTTQAAKRLLPAPTGSTASNAVAGGAALLPAPTLNTPRNGASEVATTPTFAWTAVSGANKYWLTVATSPTALPTSVTATTCTGEQLPSAKPQKAPTLGIDVIREEDANARQKLYVVNSVTKEKAVLLDLNPQFDDLSLVPVEPITWPTADGRSGSAGLYLPVDYVPGRRYPLVIQTHYFQPDTFMIDGPWSSGYAAQPLASAGFVVAQVGEFTAKESWPLFETAQEAPHAMAVYEGLIDYLDGRGLIDKGRVGLFGFSRSVYYVEYTLTHSRYPLAAAVLEDGIDAGYFQYIEAPWLARLFNRFNGGQPYGDAMLSWLKNAPGFNLDKVRCPVRIMAHDEGEGGALEQWEWFSGLKLLRKPVEMMVLPAKTGRGAHLLKQPWQRMVAQQGNVDWFRFWMQGQEDPDPSKGNQYGRWRELRELQGKLPSNDAHPVK